MSRRKEGKEHGAMNHPDSFESMMAEVRAFHQKHRFAEHGGEDMVYRVSLMAEELGEISACVTKGRPKAELAEECADLLILLMGNALAADFDLARAFREKMARINRRTGRIIDGRVRVSEFRDDNVVPEQSRPEQSQPEQSRPKQNPSGDGR